MYKSRETSGRATKCGESRTRDTSPAPFTTINLHPRCITLELLRQCHVPRIVASARTYTERYQQDGLKQMAARSAGYCTGAEACWPTHALYTRITVLFTHHPPQYSTKMGAESVGSACVAPISKLGWPSVLVQKLARDFIRVLG